VVVVADPSDQISTTSPERVGVGPFPGGMSPASPDDAGIPTRLLVLGMAHRDGTILASELHSVIDACGVSVDQLRSQLRRLVSEGLFTRDGEGRDAVFRATAGGRATLSSTLRRHTLAYAQDAAGRGWDRVWHLVAFAIPEARRADRDAIRDRLLQLGGAAIQNGLYVSPHRWEPEVRETVERLDITELTTLFSTDDLDLGGESEPRHIAARLWPLDDAAARYEEFIDTYRGVPEQLEDMRRRGDRIREEDFLPGALQIAIRFNQCFDRDPLLPPELLPRPWPGREARDVLARCRRLGVLAREDKSGPALFQVFDDVIALLP
jgi:phenylacetic acid degradation operon negative regulatory protein